MKHILVIVSILYFTQVNAQVKKKYPGDPAAVERTGVPKGELLKFTFSASKIYPGTTRTYWVYAPKQYTGTSPACLYVDQDGVQWQAPVVFDNLIHSKEMPVTIGVFVTPGKVPADNDSALDRINRSFEYDAIGDAYAKFLLTELLRLHGAGSYPILVRKYEPKPIHILLQGGENDLNIYAGDWWKANEMMERALSFAGYEVKHVCGKDGHNNQHGAAVFTEAMRWLWKVSTRGVHAFQRPILPFSPKL